jgi:hypothetical protein
MEEHKYAITSTFLLKVFDMDSPQKACFGVFELPLLRNARKRHKIKQKIKEGTYLPHLVAICQIHAAWRLVPFSFLFIFSSAPLPRPKCSR